jgi:hypothetical protein
MRTVESVGATITTREITACSGGGDKGGANRKAMTAVRRQTFLERR